MAKKNELFEENNQIGEEVVEETTSKSKSINVDADVLAQMQEEIARLSKQVAAGEQTRNINTRNSIFKDSGKTDEAIASSAYVTASEIASGKRVEYECRKELIGLFPEGLSTSVQGIHILLIFDGRKVKLPEVLIPFINDKIAKKAEIEQKKKSQTLETATKNFIGSYNVD